MSGVEVYEGTIDVGGLDVWSFTACAGENISVQVQESVAGATLSPWIRLFGTEGAELRSVSGQSSATFTVPAPASGTYTVLVCDRSGGYVGSGAYRLTVSGLSHQLRFCQSPLMDGEHAPVVVGGVPLGTFTLLTTTNVTVPRTEWSVRCSGIFDEFGVLHTTNLVDRAQTHRFFQLRVP
jgi:hypothetical protein